MLELFRYAGNDANLYQKLSDILKLLKTDQKIDYEFLKTITIYILSVSEIEIQEYVKMVERVLNYEGGELAMTTAQRLFLEGEEKGIEKGIEKAKIEDAKNFLKLGVGVEIVAPSAGCGLAMGWLMGWRKAKQLYEHFYDEELTRQEQESIMKKKAEGTLEETIEEKVQKALRERWR